MSADNFLHRHWQQCPVFMPRALPQALPALSADELGWLATLGQQRSFWSISVPIVLLGGLGTWAIAAGGVHVGVSGLIFGLFGYVVARGIFARKLGLLFLGLVAMVLYGGLVWGVMPSQPDVSWEGHLCGLLAGLITGSGARKREGASSR